MNIQSIFLVLMVLLASSCASVGSETMEPTEPLIQLTEQSTIPTETASPPTETISLPTRTTEPTEVPESTSTVVPTPPPTGRHGLIAFYSARDGNAAIYTVNTDGSDLKQLTYGENDAKCPAWSPDGSQIAYTMTTGGFSGIYIMDADGGNQHRLTDDSLDAKHPAWSPDGSQITFDIEGGGEGDLYVVNADGSDVRRLTTDDENGFWGDWSPDGQRIAFASNRDGNYEIYIMDSDGSDQYRVTDNHHLDAFPAWSPDGSKIAFMSRRNNMTQVYVIDIDGSEEQQLTFTGSVNEDPAWSPDGSQIVFQSNRDGNWEIYVMNADGSDQRRVTNHQEGDYWPSWGTSAMNKFIIEVPVGSPPVVDGVISSEEWSTAKVGELTDGSELLMMADEEHLYLGIRARSEGLGSVCVDRGEEVHVLHSSAALGTAVYSKTDAGWELVRGFSWCCRDTTLTAQAEEVREVLYQQDGWVASIVYMGTPEEMEYQIAMPGGVLNLAVTFLKGSGYNSTSWSPSWLDDDCKRLSLIQGNTPEMLHFSPETWISVTASTTTPP
jgi:TolB protein